VQYSSGHFQGGDYANLVADLNGDHHADLVAWSGDNIWVEYSTGGGFTDPQAYSYGPFVGTRSRTVLDVDGDGLDDLVAINDTGVWVETSQRVYRAGPGWVAVGSVPAQRSSSNIYPMPDPRPSQSVPGSPWPGSSFASTWLFQPKAGAIAYAGETVVKPDGFGADFAAHLAQLASSGTVLLGDAWRNAQLWYWHNESRADVIGAPRIYLGVMTLFGDPTLRLQYSSGNYSGLVAINDSTVWAESEAPGCTSTANWPACRPTEVSSVPFEGWWTTTVGDVSGDGLTDLVAWNSDSVYVEVQDLSNDNKVRNFSPPAQWSQGTFYGDTTNLIADVNGDNNADLIAFNYGSKWVELSTGLAFNPPVQWANIAFAGSTNLAADVNGDGMADLIGWNYDNVWVQLSTGNGFQDPAQWSSGPFYGTVTNVAADVNGDGMKDLVGWNETNTWVELSNGHGFGPPTARSNVAFHGNRGNFVQDVDRNGTDDLVGVADDSVWVEFSTGTSSSQPIERASNVFYGSLGVFPATFSYVP
jgi:hypothetical protein